jgi:hypothetical protein
MNSVWLEVAHAIDERGRLAVVGSDPVWDRAWVALTCWSSTVYRQAAVRRTGQINAALEHVSGRQHQWQSMLYSQREFGK